MNHLTPEQREELVNYENRKISTATMARWCSRLFWVTTLVSAAWVTVSAITDPENIETDLSINSRPDEPKLSVNIEYQPGYYDNLALAAALVLAGTAIGVRVENYSDSQINHSQQQISILTETNV